VTSILNFIKRQTARYIRAYTRVWVSEIPRSVQDHDEIEASIEAGDCNAAQRAARTNYRNATERLVDPVGDARGWQR